MPASLKPINTTAITLIQIWDSPIALPHHPEVGDVDADQRRDEKSETAEDSDEYPWRVDIVPWTAGEADEGEE